MRDIEARADRARENFKSGCSCAQAVLLAFSDKLGYTDEQLMLMSGAFGGGMGRLREVCGTFSGMIMALGMLDGYTKTTGSKPELYKKVQELAEQFREKNGSIVCRELLTGTIVKPGAAPEERTPEYYERRPCAEYCADAARLLAQMLED